VKNSLGSNWPQRTPTLSIEWGQIDPKGNRRVKWSSWLPHTRLEHKYESCEGYTAGFTLLCFTLWETSAVNVRGHLALVQFGEQFQWQSVLIYSTDYSCSVLLESLGLAQHKCAYSFYRSGSEPAPPSISGSSPSHFPCVFGHCSESSSLMAGMGYNGDITPCFVLHQQLDLIEHKRNLPNHEWGRYHSSRSKTCCDGEEYKVVINVKRPEVETWLVLKLCTLN